MSAYDQAGWNLKVVTLSVGPRLSLGGGWCAVALSNLAAELNNNRTSVCSYILILYIYILTGIIKKKKKVITSMGDHQVNYVVWSKEKSKLYMLKLQPSVINKGLRHEFRRLIIRIYHACNSISFQTLFKSSYVFLILR